MNTRNLKLKDGKWTVDISVRQPDGRLKRLRAAFPTKTEAQGHLALIRGQKAMRRLGIEVPEANRGDTLFKDFAEKVIDQQIKWRPNTKKAEQKHLSAVLASPFFKDKRLSEITTEDVATYHAERGKDHGPTANAELVFLKSIFHRALERGEIVRDPSIPVKRFRLEGIRLRILTDKEWAVLLAAVTPPLVPVLRLLVTTGMRPHEAFSLRWEYEGWDVENNLTWAVLVLDRAMIFVPKGLAKNHKDREVPLSPELVKMFEALPRNPALKGRVFPWSNCPRDFRKAVRAAKLKNVTLYTLKHTCASNWINKDRIDIVTVCEMLGHSDIKQTMRYCHSNKESKREAVERASQRVFMPAPADDSPAELLGPATQPGADTTESRQARIPLAC